VLDISDPTDFSQGFGMSISGDYPQQIIAVAINDEGTLIAYGTQQRNIRVEGRDGKRLIPEVYVLNYGFGKSEGPGMVETEAVPIKLAISPSNKWLAVQSEVGLELRDMYSGFFPQKAKVALPQTDKGVLEFSPSGKYLAGGHSQGLKVFTVPDLKIALDKPGSQATAIAFSPDG
jgi:hypothetical protein